MRKSSEKLRELAAYLAGLEADGWQLVGPVEDDYGFIRQPLDPFRPRRRS